MVRITTLGNFTITVNEKPITDNSKGAIKLWRFLNLLIINREKPLPANVLLDSIWPDEDNDISNKTLHNLVYRLRKLLAPGGADGVIFKNNCYMLNIGKDFTVDAYLMEDYYIEAANGELPLEARAALLEKAVELYNGEYMLNAYGDDVWSIMTVRRYKRMFAEIVCNLADIYYELGDCDKMIQICNKGVMLEPLEDMIYQRLVLGLKEKGQTVQAIALCEDFFNLIYRELGVRASDRLNSMYKELKGNTNQLQRSTDNALDELKEIETPNGALHCSFDVFKDVCRYEMRKVARNGTTVCIALISVSGRENSIPAQKTLKDAMRCLHECCVLTLRKGDILADYSQTQIIAMLTNLNAADTCNIVARLRRLFNERCSNGSLKIKVDTKLLPPQSSREREKAFHFSGQHLNVLFARKGEE